MGAWTADEVDQALKMIVRLADKKQREFEEGVRQGLDSYGLK